MSGEGVCANKISVKYSGMCGKIANIQTRGAFARMPIEEVSALEEAAQSGIISINDALRSIADFVAQKPIMACV